MEADERYDTFFAACHTAAPAEGSLWAHSTRPAVSLTDRCNLRCTYCMPAQGLEWTPSEQLLTDEEIIRLVTIGVQLLGIRQVRFTGGEPLLKKSLDQLIHKVKQLHTDEGKPVSTALTTNGIGLHRKATQLKDAGLDRVNISPGYSQP